MSDLAHEMKIRGMKMDSCPECDHECDWQRIKAADLKAENTRLLGRATTAEIDLGREKIKYEELVEMIDGIIGCSGGYNLHFFVSGIKKLIRFDPREYHPCEECSCPVREADKICDWCEAEQKGTT